MKDSLFYLNPLSDEEKEERFDVKIEYLSPTEIIERFSNVLTEEEKKKLYDIK